jgi:peptide/nickel transport system permease protein
MAAYLIRRFFQMILVVFLATIAIYILLNVAPGGPLSGLQHASADRKARVSEADIKRLESYLGIDKPLLMRYVVWLIGDDWLGSDWMSLKWGGYAVDEETRVRFWAEPGVAYIKPGYTLWVRGEETNGALEASFVEAKPSGSRPEGMVEVVTIEIRGSEIRGERVGGEKVLVQTTEETEFVIPGAEPRPEDGSWMNIGWLFNPYHGLLGKYAGFHGPRRGLLRMDWGTSWKLATGQPVTILVKSRLTNTLVLMGAASLLSLVIAIPIGIISAVKQYTAFDYIVTTFSFFGSAMPTFWFGLMMVLLFSYKFKDWGLPFMPAGGVFSPPRDPKLFQPGSVMAHLSITPGSGMDRLLHIVMPAIVLSLFYMAGWSRFTRSSMLEVLRQDYIRTARSKGLRERIVLSKHALRNALIPVITIVVFQLPSIFGGAIITESVFGYTGMGQLYWQALLLSDWPVVMVLLLITAILVVVATLLGDVLYTVVDPRIRLG